MVDLTRVLREIRKALAPVHRRTRLMIARAVLNLVADDSESMQRVQVDVYEGQTPDEVENFQPLGLTSVPSKDAEGIALSVGGNQDHTVLIGVNDPRIRPTGLSEGETAVYDATGSLMHLTVAGNISLEPSGSFVYVGGKTAFIARADYVDERLDLIETWAAAYIIKFADHTHTHPHGPTGKMPIDQKMTSLPPLPTVAATKGKVR